MKASIIIIGEKKEDYLLDTINSCLKQNYKKIEIILVYTYLKNIKILKKIFNKKIIFKKVLLKIKNPVHDQINKIKKAIDITSGEYVFLLDGDDIFKKNKVDKIIKLNKQNLLCLDNHIILNNKKYYLLKRKKIKENIIYKYFFNPWPDKICTSCISGPKILFKKFFLENKNLESKYLAIDVLLIIFYLNKLNIIKDVLTVKKIDDQGVDKKYSNIFSKIYWLRRIEQHEYLHKIFKKDLKIEYFICLLIVFFLKKLKKHKSQ